MMLTLIENWRAVLKHAWSVRLILLAAVLSGLEVAMQVVIAFGVQVPVPSGLFAALAGLVSFAACLARFFVQQKVSGK